MKTKYRPPKDFIAKFNLLKVAVCAILCIWISSNSLAKSFDYTVNFDTSSLISQEVEVLDGEKYIMLEWKEMMFSKIVGNPSLPVQYYQFLVPTYCNNISVNINSASISKTIQYDYPLYPVQEDIPLNVLKMPEFMRATGDAYKTTIGEPQVSIADEYFIDGFNHVVSIAVTPLGYIGATNTIDVYDEISFTISYDECGKDEMAFNPIFPSVVLSDISDDCSVIDPLGILDANLFRYSSAKATALAKKEYYYIITPKSLKDAFNDFKIWKAQKGYEVVVKTIEDILTSSTYAVNPNKTVQGNKLVDEAASLRAYLADEYQKNGFFYCLLVGHSKTSMPIRRVYNSSVWDKEENTWIDGDNYIPTDNYFIDLVSQWNLTLTNGIYSTRCNSPYYSPTIAVGRLLADKAIEISNYLKKLMLYESNPGYGDSDYLERAFFFEQDVDTDSKEVSLAGKSKNIVPHLDYLNANNIDILTDDNTKDPSILGTTGKDIIAKISNYGFTSWHGHGNPGAITTSYKGNAITPLDWYTQSENWIKIQENGNGLDNLGNGKYPQVAYSISCTISPFDWVRTASGYKDIPYNMGSAFTVAGNYGGPALLSNTRFGYTSWGYGQLGSSENLEISFIEALKKNPNIGIAESKSKISCTDSRVKMTHSLIGEPEFNVWLGKPKVNNVQLVSNYFQINAAEMDVVNSKCVLYDGSGHYFVAKTPQSIMFSLDAAPIGFDKNNYMISIWRQDYLPIIKFVGQNTTMTNEKKTFIVRDALIGSKVTSSKTIGNYTVGNGADLRICAIDGIIAKDGFIIGNNGNAMFECDQTVSLSDSKIKSGGSLNVKAKTTVLEAGFTVDGGGCLIISPN